MKINPNIFNTLIICLLMILPAGYAGAIEALPLPKAVIDQATHRFMPVIAGT